MMINNKKNRVILFLIILTHISCTSNQPINHNKSKNKKSTSTCKLSLKEVQNKDKHIIGDKIEISISTKKENIEIDSIHIFVNGEFIKSIIASYQFNWLSDQAKVGRNTIKAKAWLSDGTNCAGTRQITLFSDIKPSKYLFKVINRYPHDPKAYTQGLLIEDGFLYEGTGQWAKSAIRKIELQTGEVLQSYNLDNNLFGEGICILGDKLYQLTWQSSVGFIYNKETFQLLRRTSYHTEGWGLTTDGTNLIMSDGTNNIYFLDTESFTEINRLEVYDDKGNVGKLNELEYINGEIFANVYGKSFILIIDPKTGKVTGKVDLESLMPEGFKGDWDRVLNGIAYDKKLGKIYVTGKLWPEVFEIEISLAAGS